MPYVKKIGLERGRTTGYYMTLRHEALIVAIGAHYNRRARTPVSNSQVVQLLVEREAKRLKLPEPKFVASIAGSESVASIEVPA